MLKDIPGADLDSLEVHLDGKLLLVRAVVGSRTNIEPPVVARLQQRLDKAIKEGLPDVTVQLVIRTVNSIYASATGYLFEPRRAGLTDEDRRAQALEVILRELIARFPAVELVDFNLSPRDGLETIPKKVGLTVTVSTPYEFSPRLVKDLEQKLNEELLKDPRFTGLSYSLLVRSIIIKSSTSTDTVAVAAPEIRTAEEKLDEARMNKLRELLTSALEMNPGVKIEELYLRRTDPNDHTSSSTIVQDPTPSPSPTPAIDAPTIPRDSYSARIVIRSPQLVSASMLLEARSIVEELYLNETGFKLELDLDTSTVVGSDLYLDSTETTVPDSGEKGLDELQVSLSEALHLLVSRVNGARMDGPVTIQKLSREGGYHVFAVVTSPKPLENKTVLDWQRALLKAHPQIKSLGFQLENRLGRTIKLTPILQASEPHRTNGTREGRRRQKGEAAEL